MFYCYAFARTSFFFASAAKKKEAKKKVPSARAFKGSLTLCLIRQSRLPWLV